VGIVNIPYFKTSPITGKPSGPQSVEPSFVSQFRQGVNLIHKLGKLAGTKNFFDNRYYRFY
jgi:hypothetical protein